MENTPNPWNRGTGLRQQLRQAGIDPRSHPTRKPTLEARGPSRKRPKAPTLRDIIALQTESVG